jgi:putative DNA primase/helicase
LDRECDHVAATQSYRNNTLNRSSFKVGGLVGAGILDERLAEESLVVAGLRCGLSESEARTTVRSGLRSGIARPRAVGR